MIGAKISHFLPQASYLKAFSFVLVLAFFSGGCTEDVARQKTQAVAQEESQEVVEVDVPVVVAGKFKIKPEKRDLFLELATEIIEPTRAEKGVISYSFYEESTVPNSFIYFEEWQSREALAEHLQQPYTKRLLDKFPDMLDGEGDIRVYDVKRLTYGLDVIN